MQSTINIGIDLGTTNSAISKFRQGRVEILKNPTTWKDTTPSVVGFRNDRILVGDSARTYQEKDPTGVAAWFKRKMGTTESYRIRKQHESKTPVELSAFVLKELKTFVQDGDTVDAAVITVPASFDGIQSNATRDAAVDAGFRHVVLLQEPIAASLAYANNGKAEELNDTKWLVYDLGGGTFDVALVKISNGEMRILDHEGDNFLGGFDFDRRIVEKLLVPFINENLEGVDLQDDFQSAGGRYNSLYLRLLHLAEDAKIELSSKTSSDIYFDFDDEEVVVTITRSEFEAFIKDDIDRTANMIMKVLTRNGLTRTDIDFVLMVGGSTYIPCVRNRVGELLQVPVRTDIDPTTAVAIGAGYYAGTKEVDSFGANPKADRDYRVFVKAVYDKATTERDVLFVSRLSGDFEGLFYQIRRLDGGFNSGLRRCEERIDEDLPLIENTFNFFSFHILDAMNNVIPTNLAEFQVSHNVIQPSGQPLPQDVSLELDNVEKGRTHLRQLFPRNAVLPLRSPTITVSASRMIKCGNSNDCLRITVYDGPSTNMPESNRKWGELIIRGDELARDLPKGVDIEIQASISESRDLKISVYLPSTDQAFESVFERQHVNIDVADLNYEIAGLDALVDEHLEEAEELDDEKLVLEISSIKRETQELREEGRRLNEDDSTDRKFQLEIQKRKLAQKLDTLLQQNEGNRLLDEYYEIKSRCQALVVESGKDQHRTAFKEATGSDRDFTNPPSILKLKVKIDELNRLANSILWQRQDFLEAMFHDISHDTIEYNDIAESDLAIRDGQVAIIEGNTEMLRGAIFRLFELMPRPKRQEHQGKTGIA